MDKIFIFIIRSLDFFLNVIGINIKSYFYKFFIEKNSSNLSKKKIFNKIYTTKKWIKYKSLSGSGSDYISKKNYQKKLSEFIKYHKIKSFCDLPCGDLVWMSKFLQQQKKIKYLGCDISNIIINKNKKNYPNLKFRNLDIKKKYVKEYYDILHIKDLFFHLNYIDINLSMYSSNCPPQNPNGDYRRC
jgi:hypothetical protein